MAQAIQTTTTTQRALAYADAARDAGGASRHGTRILSRAAFSYSNESRCGSDELRAFGLVGARVGFSG